MPSAAPHPALGRMRRLVTRVAASVLDRLAVRVSAAAHQAQRAEIDQVRAELARLRSDVEAELALLRAEAASRES